MWAQYIALHRAYWITEAINILVLYEYYSTVLYDPVLMPAMTFSSTGEAYCTGYR